MAGRLNFARATFHGRQTEILELQSAWERVQLHGQVEMVMVCGYSGTGKSALVRQFKNSKFLSTKECYFCQGKADETNQPSPFACIADALTRFSESLDNTEMDTIQQRLEAVVDKEMYMLLVGMIPALSRLLPRKEEAESKETDGTLEKIASEAKEL